MSKLGSVTLINLLILGAYWVVCKLTTLHDSEGLGFLIYMMLCIALHVTALFAVGVSYAIRGEKEQRNAFMAGAGVTLLVGFSSCIGGAAI
jgi:hypothetical protein